MSIFGSLTGLKLPGMAEGGLAFGPTLALVGDNPGAANDPEVVAPLSKLNSMMGSRRMDVYFHGEARGTDLKYVIDRVTEEQDRTT